MNWQQLRIQPLGSDSWRVTGLLAGRARCLTLIRRPDASWRLLEDGQVRYAGVIGDTLPRDIPADPGLAPMEGILQRLAVTAGEAVAGGQLLYAIEAMKMQIQVCAESPGEIEAVFAVSGASLQPGQRVLSFRPLAEPAADGTT